MWKVRGLSSKSCFISDTQWLSLVSCSCWVRRLRNDVFTTSWLWKIADFIFVLSLLSSSCIWKIGDSFFVEICAGKVVRLCGGFTFRPPDILDFDWLRILCDPVTDSHTSAFAGIYYSHVLTCFTAISYASKSGCWNWCPFLTQEGLPSYSIIPPSGFET